MNVLDQNRLGKVQRFGRVARNACTALLAFVALLAAPYGIFTVVTASNSTRLDLDLGLLAFRGDHIDSLSVKTWLIAIFSSVLLIFLRSLWLIRRVFGNLARGQIYTRGNVRLLHALGLLMMIGACLPAIVLPVDILLTETQMISVPTTSHFTLSVSSGALMAALSTFATAGIVILISWIMDIGLAVSEEADELRRDSELVV
jgi:hypothetical protein